jgi:hypothetical protein
MNIITSRADWQMLISAILEDNELNELITYAIEERRRRNCKKIDNSASSALNEFIASMIEERRQYVCIIDKLNEDIANALDKI